MCSSSCWLKKERGRSLTHGSARCEPLDGRDVKRSTVLYLCVRFYFLSGAKFCYGNAALRLSSG